MTSDQSPVLPEHVEGFRPFGPDTLVRITERSVSADTDINDDAARPGTEYVVEGFAYGPDGDDPDGRAYYLLDIPDHSFGGNYWAYPEHVEVAATREQRIEARDEARATLTDTEVASIIASGAMSGSRGIEFDEADWGNGAATLSGTTDEGVKVTVMFQVVSVEVGD